jgi:homopolymeric O-antigen transport system ATP-binding protein
LFVSHNMSAISSLCQKCILMENGRSTAIGFTNDVVARYLAKYTEKPVADGDLRNLGRRGEGTVRFRRIRFFDRSGQSIINPRTGEELNIALEFEGCRRDRRPARLSIDFYDALNVPMFLCASEASCIEAFELGADDKAVCRIPRLPLSAGLYKIELYLEQDGTVEDWLLDHVPIEVVDGSFFATSRNLPQGWEARTVLVDHEWLRTS